jgi:hypothetical protein
MTYLAVCPGFHSPKLTDRAIACLDLPSSIQPIVIPTDRLLPCDPLGIDRFLTDYFATQCHRNPDRSEETPVHLSFLGFSAGTIGALGAAWFWRDRAMLGAILLCDGWGVPVLPVWEWLGGVSGLESSQKPSQKPSQTLSQKPSLYRMSHDRWTHDTWSRLGIATPSFIATPEVEHLTLWSEPDRVRGEALDVAGRAIVMGETAGTISARDYIRQALGCGSTSAGSS